MVVIEDHNDTRGFGSFLHIRDRQSRFGDPLECSCRRDHIEPGTESQCRRIATFEVQIRDRRVLAPRYFEKRLVPVNAHHVSLRSDSLCYPRGNRASAATDIQNGHSRP